MAVGVGTTRGSAGTDRAQTPLTAQATGKVAISIWLKRNGPGGGNFGIAVAKTQATGAGGDDRLQWDNANTRFQWNAVFATAAGIWVWNPSSVTGTGTWYHHLLYFDATTAATAVKVWANAVAATITRTTTGSGAKTTGANPYILGNRNAADRAWDGDWGTAAIWDNPANPPTQQDATALYNGGVGGDPFLTSLGKPSSYVRSLRKETLLDLIGGAVTVTGCKTQPHHPQQFVYRRRLWVPVAQPIVSGAALGDGTGATAVEVGIDNASAADGGTGGATANETAQALETGAAPGEGDGVGNETAVGTVGGGAAGQGVATGNDQVIQGDPNAMSGAAVGVGGATGSPVAIASMSGQDEGGDPNAMGGGGLGIGGAAALETAVATPTATGPGEGDAVANPAAQTPLTGAAPGIGGAVANAVGISPTIADASGTAPGIGGASATATTSTAQPGLHTARYAGAAVLAVEYAGETVEAATYESTLESEMLYVGSFTKIKLRIRDEDGRAGDPLTSLTLTIKRPDRTLVVIPSTDPSIIKTDTGDYEYPLVVDQELGWDYRWHGVGGPYAGAFEGSFSVARSAFANPAA